jgi:GTPase SAR1 family protein
MDRPLRKLCLLGDFRVGKTRLVCRLTGCDVPPPAFGVRLHEWQWEGAPGVRFTLFDAAGRSALDSLGQSFLSGAEGFALVADAGDADSIAVALQLCRKARELVGPRPAVLMLNKSDRVEVAAGDVPDDVEVHMVSARSGEGVEAAFAALARQVLGVERQPAMQMAGLP